MLSAIVVVFLFLFPVFGDNADEACHRHACGDNLVGKSLFDSGPAGCGQGKEAQPCGTFRQSIENVFEHVMVGWY